MQILVDADACPVKQIIVRLAKQYKIPVTMLMDTSHMLNDGYSTVITVDKEADSVDFALMGILKREDIVVTQDYGLAAMVIGKGAKAVNQNGLVFTNDNMDKLLMERHISAKVRRGGGRTKGAPKRKKDDDARFEAVFVKMLEEILQETDRQELHRLLNEGLLAMNDGNGRPAREVLEDYSLKSCSSNNEEL